MADSPFPAIVGGVTTGADARTALNNMGTDVAVAIKEVSAIAEVGNEINYFITGSIVFDRTAKKFYKYSGTAWVLYTDMVAVGDSYTVAEADLAFSPITHDHSSGNGETVDHADLANKGTNTHAQIDSHIAANGANVHGLGTISTQGADAVNITGGKINGVKFGGNADYLSVGADGTLTLQGNATVWDDLFVPLQQSKVGSNAKPDFDYTNIGYLFPQNDPTEILYFIVQLPHRWKEGSTIYPHVHWKQDANLNPVFKLDYKWFNIGDAVPANFTTYTMDAPEITYVSGALHQLSHGATGIAGTNKTFSSILECKLYRQDNVYIGDVLTFQFDIHYEIDALGSKTELSK